MKLESLLTLGAVSAAGMAIASGAPVVGAAVAATAGLGTLVRHARNIDTIPETGYMHSCWNVYEWTAGYVKTQILDGMQKVVVDGDWIQARWGRGSYCQKLKIPDDLQDVQHKALIHYGFYGVYPVSTKCGLASFGGPSSTPVQYGAEIEFDVKWSGGTNVKCTRQMYNRIIK